MVTVYESITSSRWNPSNVLRTQFSRSHTHTRGMEERSHNSSNSSVEIAEALQRGKAILTLEELHHHAFRLLSNTADAHKLARTQRMLERYVGEDWRLWKQRFSTSAVETYGRSSVWGHSGCFELLALTWTRSCASPIHNHPCERCFLLPLKGEIAEKRYLVNEETQQYKQFAFTRLKRRRAYWMDDSIGWHAVMNAGREDAVSLHLYIPQIRRCKIVHPRTMSIRWCYCPSKLRDALPAAPVRLLRILAAALLAFFKSSSQPLLTSAHDNSRPSPAFRAKNDAAATSADIGGPSLSLPLLLSALLGGQRTTPSECDSYSSNSYSSDTGKHYNAEPASLGLEGGLLQLEKHLSGQTEAKLLLRQLLQAFESDGEAELLQLLPVEEPDEVIAPFAVLLRPFTFCYLSLSAGLAAHSARLAAAAHSAALSTSFQGSSKKNIPIVVPAALSLKELLFEKNAQPLADGAVLQIIELVIRLCYLLFTTPVANAPQQTALKSTSTIKKCATSSNNNTTTILDALQRNAAAAREQWVNASLSSAYVAAAEATPFYPAASSPSHDMSSLRPRNDVDEVLHALQQQSSAADALSPLFVGNTSKVWNGWKEAPQLARVAGVLLQLLLSLRNEQTAQQAAALLVSYFQGHPACMQHRSTKKKSGNSETIMSASSTERIMTTKKNSEGLSQNNNWNPKELQTRGVANAVDEACSLMRSCCCACCRCSCICSSCLPLSFSSLASPVEIVLRYIDYAVLLHLAAHLGWTPQTPRSSQQQQSKKNERNCHHHTDEIQHNNHPPPPLCSRFFCHEDDNKHKNNNEMTKSGFGYSDSFFNDDNDDLQLADFPFAFAAAKEKEEGASAFYRSSSSTVAAYTRQHLAAPAHAPISIAAAQAATAVTAAQARAEVLRTTAVYPPLLQVASLLLYALDGHHQVPPPHNPTHFLDTKKASHSDIDSLNNHRSSSAVAVSAAGQEALSISSQATAAAQQQQLHHPAVPAVHMHCSNPVTATAATKKNTTARLPENSVTACATACATACTTAVAASVADSSTCSKPQAAKEADEAITLPHIQSKKQQQQRKQEANMTASQQHIKGLLSHNSLSQKKEEQQQQTGVVRALGRGLSAAAVAAWKRKKSSEEVLQQLKRSSSNSSNSSSRSSDKREPSLIILSDWAGFLKKRLSHVRRRSGVGGGKSGLFLNKDEKAGAVMSVVAGSLQQGLGSEKQQQLKKKRFCLSNSRKKLSEDPANDQSSHCNNSSSTSRRIRSATSCCSSRIHSDLRRSGRRGRSGGSLGGGSFITTTPPPAAAAASAEKEAARRSLGTTHDHQAKVICRWCFVAKAPRCHCCLSNCCRGAAAAAAEDAVEGFGFSGMWLPGGREELALIRVIGAALHAYFSSPFQQQSRRSQQIQREWWKTEQEEGQAEVEQQMEDQPGEHQRLNERQESRAETGRKKQQHHAVGATDDDNTATHQHPPNITRSFAIYCSESDGQFPALKRAVALLLKQQERNFCRCWDLKLVTIRETSAGKLALADLWRKVSASSRCINRSCKLTEKRTAQNAVVPLMVCCSAGRAGAMHAFDDFADIKQLCKEFVLWLHADASVGASFLLPQEEPFQRICYGLHEADSILWGFSPFLLRCTSFPSCGAAGVATTASTSDPLPPQALLAAHPHAFCLRKNEMPDTHTDERSTAAADAAICTGINSCCPFSKSSCSICAAVVGASEAAISAAVANNNSDIIRETMYCSSFESGGSSTSKGSSNGSDSKSSTDSDIRLEKSQAQQLKCVSKENFEVDGVAATATKPHTATGARDASVAVSPYIGAAVTADASKKKLTNYSPLRHVLAGGVSSPDKTAVADDLSLPSAAAPPSLQNVDSACAGAFTFFKQPLLTAQLPLTKTHTSPPTVAAGIVETQRTYLQPARFLKLESLSGLGFPLWCYLKKLGDVGAANRARQVYLHTRKLQLLAAAFPARLKAPECPVAASSIHLERSHTAHSSSTSSLHMNNSSSRSGNGAETGAGESESAKSATADTRQLHPLSLNRGGERAGDSYCTAAEQPPQVAEQSRGLLFHCTSEGSSGAEDIRKQSRSSELHIGKQNSGPKKIDDDDVAGCSYDVSAATEFDLEYSRAHSAAVHALAVEAALLLGQPAHLASGISTAILGRVAAGSEETAAVAAAVEKDGVANGGGEALCVEQTGHVPERYHSKLRTFASPFQLLPTLKTEQERGCKTNVSPFAVSLRWLPHVAVCQKGHQHSPQQQLQQHQQEQPHWNRGRSVEHGEEEKQHSAEERAGRFASLLYHLINALKSREADVAARQHEAKRAREKTRIKNTRATPFFAEVVGSYPSFTESKSDGGNQGATRAPAAPAESTITTAEAPLAALSTLELNRSAANYTHVSQDDSAEDPSSRNSDTSSDSDEKNCSEEASEEKLIQEEEKLHIPVFSLLSANFLVGLGRTRCGTVFEKSRNQGSKQNEASGPPFLTICILNPQISENEYYSLLWLLNILGELLCASTLSAADRNKHSHLLQLERMEEVTGPRTRRKETE